MSWDFTADDLRKEIKELREKLAVQGVKIGEQETKLLKNEEYLRTSKENCADALNKLRKEADRALELEETLKRRNDELRNERNVRENVEQTLRIAKEEREREAASAREAQHYLNRTASESNEHRIQCEKLAGEKTKLEAQVRELQGELQRCQVVPPPPPKTPARPRASSLTNLNKVATLERDVEQIRASASASEIDLKSTQEKLSRMQSDLVRMENEKATLEKKLKEQEQMVKDILADKSELQAEVDFYRDQNASNSREEELVARLEEEEAKVELLEQQLAKVSNSSSLKRSIDQLQAQLNHELSRRETVEAREVQLVQEREEALSEVDDLRRTLHHLKTAIAHKDIRINELEAQSSALRQQLETSENHAASNSIGIDEEKITDLVNGIARIRAERDELKAHLEFVQMEAHFKVEALEKKLAEHVTSVADDAQLRNYHSLIAQITSQLNDERSASLKLRTAAAAMLVTIQHLDFRNDYLHRQAVAIPPPSVSTASGSATDSTSSDQTSHASVSCALQDRLRVNAEEKDHLALELTSKNEELNVLDLRFSDISVALREEKDVRSSLEEQVRKLEVNLDTVKQELADALEHSERLEARQSTNVSSDAVIRSLKNEIEELRGRIMRRTEQIGLQQHDIKRLETNMRLTDERLEEVLGELEMAETAKAAMLEDCSIAREERDQTKRSLVQAELEIEQLSTRVQVMEREAEELRKTLASVEERETKSCVSKDGELSTMSVVIAERDGRIQTLTEHLEASESALYLAREQIENLRKELEAAQETGQRQVEELQKQVQSDKYAATEELERHIRELQRLSKEAEASRLTIAAAEKDLMVKTEKCRSAGDEIELLKSALEAMKASGEGTATSPQSREQAGADESADSRSLLSALNDESLAYQETKRTLLAKEEELEHKAEIFRQLSAELDAVKSNQEDSVRILQSREQELEILSAEVKRLASELQASETKQRATSSILEDKEKRLTEMGEKIMHLQAERAGLLARLEAFESETEKELMDATSLRSAFEEERNLYEQKVKQLEADLATSQAEKVEQLKASEDLTTRYKATLALLETTKDDLKEKQILCDTLTDEQQRASAYREGEAADLKKQVTSLSAEIEALHRSLQEEIDNRRREVAAHEEELQAALGKQESLSTVESGLRHTIEQYKQEIADLRANLMTLQDENTSLQSEIDNLSGDYRRANLKTQSLENQLASNSKELSDLRDELARLHEALSKSEKSGKAAEMNLLLISQQNERTISSLRNQLKEHEKDAERIQKLQQIVGETREQISEMEGLLKAKCAEIEENDDKFIQLLKEKKKLTSKVESLTKKNNNLQNKLSSAIAGAPNGTSPSENSARRNSPMEPVQSIPPTTPTPFASIEVPVQSTVKPRVSERVVPSQFTTPIESRRMSGSKRRRESTPPLDEIPATTSIGKKRPLPDDSDTGRAPVEARFPDTIRAEAGSSSTVAVASSSSLAPSIPPLSDFTSTPRQRRAAPRSGFTPVRGHAAGLRPTLSQPSPVRRSAAAQALQASTVISDITNSPPRFKRVFTAEPDSAEPRVQKPAGKGWLGKIRGGTNPLLRTRQRPNTESQP